MFCNKLILLYFVYISILYLFLEQQYEKACYDAIKKQIAVDMHIARMNFVGLPRSGKSSTLRRLIGEILNIITAKLEKENPSTGVAERKQTFIRSINKRFGFVSLGYWSTEDLIGETRVLNDLIYQYVKGMPYHNYSKM